MGAQDVTVIGFAPAVSIDLADEMSRRLVASLEHEGAREARLLARGRGRLPPRRGMAGADPWFARTPGTRGRRGRARLRGTRGGRAADARGRRAGTRRPAAARGVELRRRSDPGREHGADASA